MNEQYPNLDFGSGEPPIDRQEASPHEKEQAYKQQIENGYVPALGNGFRFVIDHRPEGQQADRISPDDFTRYFSEGKVPIADKDHRLHEHDIGHISSYTWAFGCKDVANLVRTAATNALPDHMLCIQFSDAMDSFGDSLRNIENARLQNQAIFIGDITAARISLSELAQLKNIGNECYTQNDEYTLLKQIQEGLGLPSLQTTRNELQSMYSPY